MMRKVFVVVLRHHYPDGALERAQSWGYMSRDVALARITAIFMTYTDVPFEVIETTRESMDDMGRMQSETVFTMERTINLRELDER